LVELKVAVVPLTEIFPDTGPPGPATIMLASVKLFGSTVSENVAVTMLRLDPTAVSGGFVDTTVGAVVSPPPLPPWPDDCGVEFPPLPQPVKSIASEIAQINFDTTLCNCIIAFLQVS
jgi:hypothetical protein